MNFDAGAQPGADDTFGDGGPVGWDDYGFGQATVADGVNLIAGGIENVLQRFRLQVPHPAPSAVGLTFQHQNDGLSSTKIE